MALIRTRYAPSPTGYTHIGNLRTTISEFLFAKSQKGVFIIRVEDTDQGRLVPGAMENMLKTLEWVGIKPDEGVALDANGNVVEKGDFGPYIQSKRLPIYQKYAQTLLDNGNAYYAFDTAEELTAMRDTQQANKQATKYDRMRMRNQYTMSPEELQKVLATESPRVVRLKVPDSGTIEVNDIIHGKTVFDVKEVDDQVLLKSDGFPTYHLAVVVDDHLMEITHVIRGDDWMSSTPKHLLIYKAFGWNAPVHAHVPLVLGSDKLKLSKRKGDVSTESYRTKGYLPEALLNFLAFLGWNPGTDKEIYSMDELIKDFTLEKVSKAGAVFNLEKLNWFNKEYIKKLSNAELVGRAKPWLDNSGLNLVDAKLVERAVSLERERITTLAELPEAIKFVFELPQYEKNLLVWKKGTLEEVGMVLPKLSVELEKIDESAWSKESIESVLLPWIKEQSLTNGAVLWPMRVALSGQQNSPGPFDIAGVLGKAETLKRLGHAQSLM